MKLIMYGTQICPDCVEAKLQITQNQEIELDYRSITESTAILKEFLSYRDHEDIFKPIINKGSIGIPFFILEDGTKTFEITDFMEGLTSSVSAASCSLDGSGQC